MDWDQDGILDIITGCYWSDDADAGHLQILKGKPGFDFEPSVALENSAGKPIENMVAGAGEDDSLNNRICTQQHAVDYDGDGDLDLVVGCFGTNYFLHENKADQENGLPSLVKSPIKLPIESPSYHAAPHLADWDNDGDLDLLSGSGDGGVLYSENVGTRSQPEWSEFKQLVEYAEHGPQMDDGNQPIKMSPSTRVWTTDFNHDGQLDLLVGDSATIVTPKKGVSVEECNRLLAENDLQMNALNQQARPLYAKLEQLKQADEDGKSEDKKEIKEKLESIRSEMMELYESRFKFQESKSTGFVWLLIRKPQT